MGIRDKLAQLNDADLSKLSARIDAIRKKAEAPITVTKSATTVPATAAPGAGIAVAGESLTLDQLLSELEHARRIS
jgi:hypothetical protein